MSVSGPLGATPHGAAFDLTRPGLVRHRPPVAPRSLSGRQGLIGLGGLLVTVLAVSLAASQTNVLLPQSVQFGVPRSLAGPFGGIGLNLGLAGVIAVFTLMFLSYALAIRAVDQL
jgi:hypothetical protein